MSWEPPVTMFGTIEQVQMRERVVTVRNEPCVHVMVSCGVPLLQIYYLCCGTLNTFVVAPFDI